jgi:hypothetical protein
MNEVKLECEPNGECKTMIVCEPLLSGSTVEQLTHLRELVRKHQDMQKARQAFENRVRSLVQGATQEGRLGWLIEDSMVEGMDNVEMPEGYEDIGRPKKKFHGLQYWEDDLVKQMKLIVENNKLYVEWLGRVKGIGILTAAKMIAYFEPYWAEMEMTAYVKKKERTGEVLDAPQKKTFKLYRPKSRSSLIKLCGYGVDETSHRAFCRANYNKESCMGNAEYKKTMYVLFDAVIRQKGKCYDLFKRYHEETLANYEKYLIKHYGYPTRIEVKKNFPKQYIPNSLDLSRRRFIKTFLSILWEKYQEIYNLPISRPQHNPDPNSQIKLSDAERELSDTEWLHPEDLCE